MRSVGVSSKVYVDGSDASLLSPVVSRRWRHAESGVGVLTRANSCICTITIGLNTEPVVSSQPMKMLSLLLVCPLALSYALA